ncbi:hypothetical protein CBR_g49776 [Chara braunii]|uniref:CCHC-type domain-containing protein n=1 Tax=Chara braunii TaxID=69332 RepID=A0A388M5V8_CHABU|nr:hypothetical protein CBR_g49776 [Chara braunii]|eukprot:GBG89926.1 hypothetical protein CBR_g49776 [Chara braunii]
MTGADTRAPGHRDKPGSPYLLRWDRRNSDPWRSVGERNPRTLADYRARERAEDDPWRRRDDEIDRDRRTDQYRQDDRYYRGGRFEQYPRSPRYDRNPDGFRSPGNFTHRDGGDSRDTGNLIGIAETDIVEDMIGRTEQETDVPTPEETGAMILEEIGETIPVGDMTEEDILRRQGIQSHPLIPGLKDHPTQMPEHWEYRRLEPKRTGPPTLRSTCVYCKADDHVKRDCPDLKRAIDEGIVVLDDRKYVQWADDLGDISMFPSMKENVDARQVRPSKGKEVVRSRSIRILMSLDEDEPTTPIRVAATKSARPSSSRRRTPIM